MLSGSASPPPLPLQEGEDEATSIAVSAERLSPYQEAEVRTMELMRQIRVYITEVDKLTSSDSPAKRLELNNAIRKCEAELRTLLQEARRLAVVERRVESYGKLQQQSTKTQQLIRAHYGTLVGLDRGANHFSLMDEDEAEPTAAAAASSSPSTHYDIAQDQEFQDFFHEVRQNDAQMDAALDRIEFGVQRIHDNALHIKYEMKTQEKMMLETEKQADKNEAQIAGMNKKLQKMIKKLGKSRLIVYVVLCVILTVLIIVVIFLGKSI